MQNGTVDNELCFLHKASGNSKQLLAIMAKHVDDLKLTGSKEVIIWILQQIEKEFGNLRTVDKILAMLKIVPITEYKRKKGLYIAKMKMSGFTRQGKHP